MSRLNEAPHHLNVLLHAIRWDEERENLKDALNVSVSLEDDRALCTVKRDLSLCIRLSLSNEQFNTTYCILQVHIMSIYTSDWSLGNTVILALQGSRAVQSVLGA